MAGFSTVDLTSFFKYSKWSKNNLFFWPTRQIYTSNRTIRVSFKHMGLKFTLGNTNIGVIWFQIVFKEAINITFCPRFSVVVWPNFFIPLGPIFFGGVLTIVQPDSSQLQIFSWLKFSRDKISWEFLEKEHTYGFFLSRSG